MAIVSNTSELNHSPHARQRKWVVLGTTISQSVLLLPAARLESDRSLQALYRFFCDWE